MPVCICQPQFDGEVSNAEAIEKELVKKAEKQGVKVYALSDYYIKEIKRRPTILLGFSRLKEHEIIDGIKRLKRAWM